MRYEERSAECDEAECGSGPAYSTKYDTAGEVSQQGTGCLINFTKAGCLVFAIGTSASQFAMRTKLTAVAVSTCCKCVFAAPK
jgi:hypothetical protein